MRIALLGCLAACSFGARAAPQHDGDDGIDAPAIDAPASDALIDARPDAPADATTARPFCDTADATLVVCYTFEGTTHDGGPHHLDATATNVTFDAGKVGMAAHSIATTAMNVAENAALNPSTLTIEAWIKAPLPGAGGRAGIVDNEGLWGFFLHEQGELQCITGTNVVANVPANTWTHVACTYDGNGTRVIYVNGTAVDTATGGAPLGSTAASGITLAANSPDDTSPLLGDLDQVRIFSVARTAQQINADAGH